MNSINQQQAEDNHEDLIGKEAIKKIKELTDKAGTCFFCTKIKTHESFSARPMTLQKVDERGNLLFLSAIDSSHNQEILEDPFVQLLFQGSSYADFLNLYGTASISQDKTLIKELWSPLFKTWFTGGEDDPRISVITINPWEGYYWDTKHNMAIGIIKRLVGAAMGKTIDDSVEGHIKV
ncbi:pyridoxamine 5'-phosphate oxidase family protein [Ferruginibacter sp.]